MIELIELACSLYSVLPRFGVMLAELSLKTRIDGRFAASWDQHAAIRYLFQFAGLSSKEHGCTHVGPHCVSTSNTVAIALDVF